MTISFNECFNLLVHECEILHEWAVRPLTILLATNPRKQPACTPRIHINRLLSVKFPIHLLPQLIFPVASYQQNTTDPACTIYWSAEIIDRHRDTEIEDNSIYFSYQFIDFIEYSINQYGYYVQYESTNQILELFRRPAIEPHEQNQRFDTTSSFFIEVLREYARHHADDNAIAERWWKSSVPLLQRLAISAINMSNLAADSKLSWILDKEIIITIRKHMALWHELMTILRASIGESSSNIRNRLLQQLRRIDESNNDSSAAATQYDILDFMLSALPEESWQEANAFRARLAQQYNLEPTAHPDFRIWDAPAQWQMPQEIIDDTTFLRLLSEDPSYLLSLLFSRENLPSVNATLFYQIPRLVKKDTQVGLTLWNLASSNHENISRLQAAILNGWAYQKQSTEDLCSIIAQLGRLPQQSMDSFSDTIIRLIYTQIEKADDEIPTDALEWMDSFAATQWAERHASFAAHDRDSWENDPVTLSLNCWPGALAWYWVQRIQYRKAYDSSDWPGFNEAESNALSQFAQAKGDLAFVTHPPLLFNVNLLHALDSSFIEEIIPQMLQTDDTVTVWRIITQYHIQPNLRLMRLFFFDSLYSVLKKEVGY